eukprot:PhF_6_TR5579/c2_g2_i3/m.7987
MSVMNGHTIRVRSDNLSEAIPVRTGVLQGDTLAPYLFIVVLDSVLRQLPEDKGILLGTPARVLSKRQSCAFLNQTRRQGWLRLPTLTMFASLRTVLRTFKSSFPPSKLRPSRQVSR